MSELVFVENCQVLSQQQFNGEQFIITLQSEKIANNTKSGQFVYIRCSDELLMRRPISIMTVDIKNNSFTLLYKKLGNGTARLAQAKAGDYLNVMGPIGNSFVLDTTRKKPLLIGGGVGIPPMIAIAQEIKNTFYEPLVILGSEVPFPFKTQKSKFPDIANATHSMPLLEGWGIPSRLTSNQNYAGVFQGFTTDLAREFFNSLSDSELSQVAIYSCGPEPMLKAVFALTKEYNLPCQVSLEEYMACAIGGCAGCVVEVNSNQGKAMKRVCVDGPIFNAFDVYS